MRHAYAAAVIAATLLLSGCSDDGADPSTARSTWTPSGTIDTPSPSAEPTPTEPPLPDAATKATEAGARAFITYYWDLINYAQATGDLRAAQRASGPRCSGCNRALETVRKLYAAGGHLEGGDYAITSLETNQLPSRDRDNYAFEARVRASSTAAVAVNGDGSTESYSAGMSTVVIAVIWLVDRWRLDAFEVS